MASEQDDDRDHPRTLPYRTTGFHICPQGMDEEGGKEFRRTMASQGQGQVSRNVPTEIELEPQQEDEEESSAPTVPPSLKHQSLALRPLTFGNWNWIFDAVAELTKPSTFNSPPPLPPTTGLSVPELAYLPPGMTKKQDTLTSQLSQLVIPQTQTTKRPALPSLQLYPC